MRSGLIGFLAVLALSGTAWGQAAQTDPTAGESKLAGFKFPSPATVLTDDDGTYRQTLDGAAKVANLQCGALEAFGWAYESAEKGQPLIDATIKSMTDAGYKIKALNYKPSEKSQVFPGLATGNNKSIVLMWAADPTAATLVLCEGQTPKKEASAPKKETHAPKKDAPKK